MQLDMEAEDYSGERMPQQFSVKVGYVLTDTPTAGMANTWLLPRRHKSDSFERPPEGVGQPEGAVPVVCPANSCFIFDRRCFHSPTPNWSEQTRKVCFVGYSYRWLQPKDGMYVEPAMERARCPVLMQLLGYTSSNSGLYQPNAVDTPLRPWLHHACGITDPLGPDVHRPEFGWSRDGFGPLPLTVRELESQGSFEGDTGHSTRARAGARPYSRAESRRQGDGDGGQTMKEKLDAEERASLLSSRNASFSSSAKL